MRKKAVVITQAFELLKAALSYKLGALGYLISEEKNNDPLYGSRYITWSNNTDVLRLTWDGKETVFIVETTNELPVSVLTKWTTISVTSFNPAFDNSEYIYMIVEQVLHSLN